MSDCRTEFFSPPAVPTPVEPGVKLFYQETTLSALQMRTLNTVAVELIAAPGAGKIIMPVMMIIEYNFSGSAFGATGTLVFTYEGDATHVLWAYNAVNPAGWMNVAASAMALNLPINSQTVSKFPTLASAVNKGVSVFNNAAAMTLGGSSTVVFKCLYYVVPSP